MGAAIEYRERPLGITDDELKNLPSIKKNWEYSSQCMRKINNILNNNICDDTITIVVAGSFGRFEAGEHSDLDFYIIHENDNTFLQKYCDIVNCTARELDIIRPNPDGIFSSATNSSTIKDKIGSKDDDIQSIVQRLILLMETKPLYNQVLYSQIIESVLDRYLELVKKNPKKEAVFLLNDTIRCFRSICVSNQFQFWNEHEKWGLRNIKLRHSRVITYCGLLLLIMNASKYTNKYEYLYKNIDLTPIERIANVFKDNKVSAICEFLKHYDFFIEQMNNKDIRDALIVDYDVRHSNYFYEKLKKNSDIIQRELTEFVLSQRGVWSNRIYEYLMF